MAPSLKDLRICPLGLLLGERSELRERGVRPSGPWAPPVVHTHAARPTPSPPARARLPPTRLRHAVAENAGYTCHLPHSAFEELLLEHGCGKLQPVPNSATGAW